MRPSRIANANMTLKMPTEEPCDVCGGDGSEECPGCWGSHRRGDLPARRAEVEGQGPVLTSAWRPDDGERRAIANGADVELAVWGEGQPPVALAAGEPSVVAERLFTAGHVEAALRTLRDALAERLAAEDDDRDERAAALLGDADEWLRRWERALRETAPAGSHVSGPGML